LRLPPADPPDLVIVAGAAEHPLPVLLESFEQIGLGVARAEPGGAAASYDLLSAHASTSSSNAACLKD
jgi:hypothetical protein